MRVVERMCEIENTKSSKIQLADVQDLAMLMELSGELMPGACRCGAGNIIHSCKLDVSTVLSDLKDRYQPNFELEDDDSVSVVQSPSGSISESIVSRPDIFKLPLKFMDVACGSDDPMASVVERVEVIVQRERARLIVRHTGSLWQRLIRMEQSVYDFDELLNNNKIGELLPKKNQATRMTVPNDFIFDSLFKHLITMKYPVGYKSRDEKLSHMFKLAQKFTKDNKMAIVENSDVNKLYATIQKACDEECSNFMYAYESQQKARQTIFSRTWNRIVTWFSGSVVLARD
jgi:hypothetical protein